MQGEVGATKACLILAEHGVLGSNGKPLSTKTLRRYAMAGLVKARQANDGIVLVNDHWMYDVDDLLRLARVGRPGRGRPRKLAAAAEG